MSIRATVASTLAALALWAPSPAFAIDPPGSESDLEAERAARAEEDEEAREAADRLRDRRMRSAERNFRRADPTHDEASYDELDYELDKEARGIDELDDLEESPSEEE